MPPLRLDRRVYGRSEVGHAIDGRDRRRPLAIDRIGVDRDLTIVEPERVPLDLGAKADADALAQRIGIVRGQALRLREGAVVETLRAVRPCRDGWNKQERPVGANRIALRLCHDLEAAAIGRAAILIIGRDVAAMTEIGALADPFIVGHDIARRIVIDAMLQHLVLGRAVRQAEIAAQIGRVAQLVDQRPVAIERLGVGRRIIGAPCAAPGFHAIGLQDPVVEDPRETDIVAQAYRYGRGKRLAAVGAGHGRIGAAMVARIGGQRGMCARRGVLLQDQIDDRGAVGIISGRGVGHHLDAGNRAARHGEQGGGAARRAGGLAVDVELDRAVATDADRTIFRDADRGDRVQQIGGGACLRLGIVLDVVAGRIDAMRDGRALGLHLDRRIRGVGRPIALRVGGRRAAEPEEKDAQRLSHCARPFGAAVLT